MDAVSGNVFGQVDWLRRSVAEDHAGFAAARPGATVRDLWEHLAQARRQCEAMLVERGDRPLSGLPDPPDPLAAEVAAAAGAVASLEELDGSLGEHLSVVEDLAAELGWGYPLAQLPAGSA